MQYLVVKTSGCDLGEVTNEIVKEINKLCSDNWKPQGGISVAVITSGYCEHYDVLQAMVKED